MKEIGIESETDTIDDNDNVFQLSLAPDFPQLHPFDDIKHRRATVSGGSPTLNRPSITVSDTDAIPQPQQQRPKSSFLPLRHDASDDVILVAGSSAKAFEFGDCLLSPPIDEVTVSLPADFNLDNSADFIDSSELAISVPEPPQPHTADVTSRATTTSTATATTSSRSPATSASSVDSVFASRSTEKSSLDTTDSSGSHVSVLKEEDYTLPSDVIAKTSTTTQPEVQSVRGQRSGSSKQRSSNSSSTSSSSQSSKRDPKSEPKKEPKSNKPSKVFETSSKSQKSTSIRGDFLLLFLFLATLFICLDKSFWLKIGL